MRAPCTACEATGCGGMAGPGTARHQRGGHKSGDYCRCDKCLGWGDIDIGPTCEEVSAKLQSALEDLNTIPGLNGRIRGLSGLAIQEAIRYLGRPRK